MEHSNNTGKIIGAFVIGAAVGAALGILFAPDKGSETRKKLAGKAGDMTDALKEKFDALMEDAKAEYEIAKEKAMEFAENGRSK